MIGTAVGIAQLGIGLIKSARAKEDREKAAKEREMSLAPLKAAVKETARMKQVTQATGADVAQEQIRQSTADVVGQAQQTYSDPNKIAAVAGQANQRQLQSGRSLDVAAQQERLQGSQMHIQTLSNLSQGKQSNAAITTQQATDSTAEGANLLGAGAGNIVAEAQGNKILDAYGEIQAGTYKGRKKFDWGILDIFNKDGMPPKME